MLATVAFLLGLLAIDRLLAAGLERVYAGVRSGQLVGLVNHALDQTDKELLVFGSSRAVYHIDPEVVGAKLGLSGFNAGSPGQGVLYARGVQALLLERGSRAKLHLLHVDPKDLWAADPQRIARLAPFFGSSRALDHLLVAQLGPNLRWKLALGTYRYNSLVLPLLNGWLRPGPDAGSGFRTLPGRRGSLEPGEPAPAAGPIRPDVEQVFRDFVRAGREQGAVVAFVASPRWRPHGLDPIERIGRERLAEIAAEEGAAWLAFDLDSHPIFRDETLFADPAHLNARGARLFSEQLADALLWAGLGPSGAP